MQFKNKKVKFNVRRIQKQEGINATIQKPYLLLSAHSLVKQ